MGGGQGDIRPQFHDSQDLPEARPSYRGSGGFKRECDFFLLSFRKLLAAGSLAWDGCTLIPM